MARTIIVSDEVYELLKRLKRPGESFSDLIKRLILKNMGSLLDLVGSDAITAEGARLLEEYKRRMVETDLERLRRIMEN
ncbi:MAG: hypothetical protein DRJ32_02625 [Thermoprotei archaeon]|nr:MAG: hypothetical protein DRJ32_02625 [Thermoprotei archaeon]HDD64370.1 hypothetical protein [Thermoprotei archaeon]